MSGQILIDGKLYRWLGPNPNLSGRSEIEPIPQTSVSVTATRSTYKFKTPEIELTVEFCSPLLADQIEILARPCSYITLSQKSLDGKAHSIKCYFDVCGEMIVDNTSSKVDARRFSAKGMNIVAMKSVDHLPLSRTGDMIKCDWGNLYLNGPGTSFIADDQSARGGFASGAIPDDDARFPRAAHDNWPVIGYQFELKDKPETISVAYDEGYAMEFFGRKLRPYWNRKEIGPLKMLRDAVTEFPTVHSKCVELDEKVADTASNFGPEYAQLVALSYRQCLAAHGLAEDLSAGLLHFSKENSSNGCMDTADVVFPASPFFLLFSPKLLLAQVIPLMIYAESSRWPWDFAPHDLGQYPLANGQVYGGGERTKENQMPVEETANILLMLAGIERRQSDVELIRKHMPLLTTWAAYLEAKGLDPENQLCTDDFSGHLAHNANLSIKAIIAVRAFAELADKVGSKQLATKYKALSTDWAKKWADMAKDGQPTVLAFGQPGTWSVKYNLMWDRLLGYNLFPSSLAEAEVDGYLAKANVYGVPLDNRASFTKTDWLYWASTLTKDPQKFSKLNLMIYKWVNETPDRVPFSDWYDTKSGRQTGFQARSVIGGITAPLLMQLFEKGR